MRKMHCRNCYEWLTEIQSGFCSAHCVEEFRLKTPKIEFQEIKIIAPIRRKKRFKNKKRPSTNSFNKCRNWRILRYQVLKRYGRVCMCCGTVAGQMHVDHIRPRSRYPYLEMNFNNLQILCRDCNLGKEAWDETDWRPAEKKPLNPIVSMV